MCEKNSEDNYKFLLRLFFGCLLALDETECYNKL